MNRRHFFPTLAAAASAQPPASTPNIVFFMVDQLSARWLEDPTPKIIPTPNLDRIRREGVTFTRAFTSNPICCAARSSLATGLTTRGHGVLQNGYELDVNIPTFMRLCQQQGYRTGAFGKLHHHVHFHGVHTDYRPYGYDVVHNTEDPRAGEWLDWVEKEAKEHYTAALATIWATEIPELKSYGPNKINLSERIKQIRPKFQWATKEHPYNTPGQYTLPFPDEVCQTEWITRHALDFLRSAPSNKPVLAHISYVQPHSPFCPPARYMKDVDPSAIPAPAAIEWLTDPSAPKCFLRTEGVRKAIPDTWRRYRHYYYADLVHLDRQLGRVLETLEQTGRLQNTVLIFLSDHGELLMDHGFSGKGERHYDACIRVPLTIMGPGFERGTTRGEFVQLEDIFPTVLELAKIPQPRPKVLGQYLKMSEADEQYPGHSLIPLCRGEKPSWRDSVYIESYNNIGSTTPAFWARTIVTADHRYTLYPGNQGEQLFHLPNDPQEQRNLATTAKSIRTEMRDRLLEAVILQDYPHTPNNRYSLGVH